MEYDQQNRLERVKIGGVTVAQYRYNALGQRTHKITGTGTTTFLYDPSGQLLGETLHDASGQPQSSQFYVWLDDLPLGGIGVTYGANGSVASSEPFFLHVDHLGTPRLATNANQQTVWTWVSDAYGVGAASGSLTVNLRFPGQYFDQETGLHYNYFRDYDPETGRYVESDPIGLDGGLNTYGYVEGNPITFSDPLGLSKSNRGGGSNVGSNLSGTAAGRVNGLTRDIQRYDPGFNYQTMRPQGRNYGREDIVALQKILQQYQMSGFCPLPRDTYTQNYLPLGAAQGRPHTVLGHNQSRNAGTYTQGAQFGSGNQFEGRWDITNHGRPQNHTSPHFHRATGSNSTE